MRQGAAATVVVVLGLAVSLLSSGPAEASNWVIPVAAGSAGEATAQGLPGLPSPSAACQSAGSKVIVVTWGATTHANYTVYQSTTTVGGTYSAVATGLTTGTWTTASLANGNDWFKVQGFIGSNWASGQSAATGETTIQNGATKCVQP
jgi:hypothetical protein